MTDKPLCTENIGQTFKTKRGPLIILRDISLTVAYGEYIALVGHSGCDKLTSLNLIIGLTRSTTDGLILAEREIVRSGPDRAVVFQNHSLLPWLTCSDNVYFTVERVSGRSEIKAQLHDCTHTALVLVDLSHTKQKYPHEISGEMKQHVEIACALPMEPKMLLMDEPFGTLGVLTRTHLQDGLLKIMAATDSTVVIITHDVNEAVLPTDCIVMMTNGPTATIDEVLAVDLPRPRDWMALAEDPTYHAYRTVVSDFLYRKQKYPVAEAA